MNTKNASIFNLFCLSVTVFFVVVLHAQGAQGYYQGEVFDAATNERLEGVLVENAPAGGSGITDGQGVFSFNTGSYVGTRQNHSTAAQMPLSLSRRGNGVISWTSNSDVGVRLFELNGRTVACSAPANGPGCFAFPKLPQGEYLAEIAFGKEISTAKITAAGTALAMSAVSGYGTGSVAGRKNALAKASNAAYFSSPNSSWNSLLIFSRHGYITKYVDVSESATGLTVQMEAGGGGNLATNGDFELGRLNENWSTGNDARPWVIYASSGDLVTEPEKVYSGQYALYIYNRSLPTKGVKYFFNDILNANGTGDYELSAYVKLAQPVDNAWCVFGGGYTYAPAPNGGVTWVPQWWPVNDKTWTKVTLWGHFEQIGTEPVDPWTFCFCFPQIDANPNYYIDNLVIRKIR
jgi:hypothetical protein